MNRIQVDLGSALSIMSRRVMQHLGIPTHRLSATRTIIYGFNTNGTCPMGKIKLRYQIKKKYDRPLHYTGYIASSEVSHIQVNLGSPLSIMPRKVMQHLDPHIPIERYLDYHYGFSANGTRSIGKIKLRCQSGN